MASQSSCFVNSYPRSLMGKFVNQFETPLRLRVSIIFFVFSSDVARNCHKPQKGSALISPLLLPSLLSVLAISAKICKPKPPRRADNESITLSASIYVVQLHRSF